MVSLFFQLAAAACRVTIATTETTQKEMIQQLLLLVLELPGFGATSASKFDHHYYHYQTVCYLKASLWLIMNMLLEGVL